MRFALLSFWVVSSASLACGGVAIDGGDASNGQDGSQSTGPTPCDGQTCKVGEVCVVTTAGGGPCLLPDDAGVCPNGSHSTGCCDNTTTTYACAPLPTACGAALACPCASSLCQCGGCQIPDAGVLACQCMYP